MDTTIENKQCGQRMTVQGYASGRCPVFVYGVSTNRHSVAQLTRDALDLMRRESPSFINRTPRSFNKHVGKGCFRKKIILVQRTKNSDFCDI